MKHPNPGKFLGASSIISLILASMITLSVTGAPSAESIFRVFAYLIILVAGSVLFSILWVTTAGMDARSVANQIESMGMQVPGFRRDPRIVEQVLNRYIPSLTIISNFYEQISQRYVEDMNPAVRKFFE